MVATLRRQSGIDARSGDFQRRYEPNFAWKSLASAISCLPGLRVSFTTAAFDSNGDLFGTSSFGPGAVLSYNGNPQFGISSLVPYVQLDGTGDYFDRADDANNSITGTIVTEPYVQTADLGLTMGVWVYPTSIGAQRAVWGKWNTNGVDQRSYLIDLTAGGVFRAQISRLGTAATISTVSSSVAVSASAWYYVSLSFDPGARLAINVNGTIDDLIVGVEASIFDSSANLVLGAQDQGVSNLFIGRLSATWLCAMYHEDYYTRCLFEQTRAMYGR